MKKKTLILLSYLLVAVLASTATLAVDAWLQTEEMTKLEQLEDLIHSCFIGEADSMELQDAAAEGMIAATFFPSIVSGIT